MSPEKRQKMIEAGVNIVATQRLQDEEQKKKVRRRLGYEPRERK